MRYSYLQLSASILLALCLLAVTSDLPRQVSGASGQKQAVVGIWNSTCHSSNITAANCGSLPLTVGSSIVIDVNVTNAPLFNGYDLRIFYDSKFVNATATRLDNTLLTAPSEAKKELSVGTVREAAVNLSPTPISGNGSILHIDFKILAVGVSPLSLAAGMTIPSSFAQSYTQVTLGYAPLDVITADGYFKNVVGKLGPVASFTISPAAPKAGQEVTFNATASFDPDNNQGSTKGIKRYLWDFGDSNTANVTIAITKEIYSPSVGQAFAGNFSARLTVVDQDDGFSGMQSQRLYVAPNPVHDVVISTLAVTPGSVKPGDKVTVAVSVRNQGTFDEVFNLTVDYGPPTKVLNQTLAQPIPASLAPHLFTFTLDTTGLSTATYQITATVSFHFGNTTKTDTKTAFLVVALPSNSPLLYVVAGAIGVAAAIGMIGFGLRRRRRRLDASE